MVITSEGTETIPWQAAPCTPIDRDGPGSIPFHAVTDIETPILTRVLRLAAAGDEAIAMQDDSSVLSYRDLAIQALALAAVIAREAPAGQAVGIHLRDTASVPIAWLACLAAATPAMLLDHSEPPERVATLAAEAGLAAIVTEAPHPGLRCIAPCGHPAASAAPRVLPLDAPAFIICTSGSTGAPKGIVHSQRSVLYRASLLVNSGHLHREDRYLSLNTPASMGGLLNAVAAWLAGATLHRVDLAGGGIARVLQRIRTAPITAVIGVPAIYRALTRLSSANTYLASLRLLSSNGEALLAADLARLRSCLRPDCHIQMVYGATETQAAMRFIPFDEVSAEAQVAVGRPIPGSEFAILHDDGTPAGDGEAGELFIRSRFTAVGEWQGGQCVAGRMLPDGCAAAGWRRYAMGDVVRMRADGTLLVLGRRDRQLKLNGHRIEPLEVEAVLRSDPAVLDAAVLPLPGPVGPELVAYAATADDAVWLRPRLETLLLTRLPPHARPRRLHLVGELPLLPSNKLDTAALRRIDAEA